MKRKILIACVALLSVVLIGCFLFILKMETQPEKQPVIPPTGELGGKDTVETEASGSSTQNTDSENPTETNVTPESTTTPTETTPSATTKPTESAKPSETTKPTQSTKPAETTAPTKGTGSADGKLDDDELPLVPNK